MAKEYQTLKHSQCIQMVKACNASGKPKRKWCQEQGISYSTFMRWQKRLRDELAGEIMATQEVVPLPINPPSVPSVSEVIIQKDDVSVRICNADSDTVIAIVRGLASC